MSIISSRNASFLCNFKAKKSPRSLRLRILPKSCKIYIMNTPIPSNYQDQGGDFAKNEAARCDLE